MTATAEHIKLNGHIYNKLNLEEYWKNNNSEDLWRRAIYDFLKNWFDDSDYISTYTSGSTGKPKEIKLKKETMRNSARMTNSFFKLNESKSALLCLPASYIAGKMMLVRAIVGEFNIRTIEPQANPFVHVDEPIDFVAITPYQLNYSAKTLKDKKIKDIIVGGGSVNSNLEELAAHIPAKMYETYGMTETASHIALRLFNSYSKTEDFSLLSGISIHQDNRGCLVIKAPHLTENEIITNDIVEIKNQTTFRWLGRADSVINSGGIKIHPEQVEKKLEKLISTNFFITSLSDGIFGEKVVLIIEQKNGKDKVKLFLESKFSEHLNKYEIPKEIYFADKFHYSESNKILKKETLHSIKLI